MNLKRTFIACSLAVAAGKELIAMSPLGIEASEADLGSGFSIKKVLRDKADEVWEQPWGENKIVRDRHKEMAVVMENQDGVGLVMRFRAFDDGVGFRYEYETGLDSLTVMAENTEFLFAEDGHTGFIVRRLDVYGQAPFKTGAEAFFQGFNIFGRLIGRYDNLFFGLI